MSSLIAANGKQVALYVLVAAEDAELYRTALGILEQDYRVKCERVASAPALRRAVQEREWDLLLCDPAFDGGAWRTVLAWLRESGRDLLVVALSQGTEDEALVRELLRGGVRAALGPVRVGRLAAIVSRELEDARRRRLRDLRALLESSPDPMAIVGAGGRLLQANRLLEGLLGYTAAELEGQPVELLVPEALRARHLRERQVYCDEPHVRPMGAGIELSARHKDGSEIPVEISLGPVRLGGEQLVCCGLRDLRERRRAERLLRSILEGTAAETGEAFLRALVKNLAHALDMRHALISELTASGDARVLAFWDGAGFAQPFVYAHAGSPSASVVADAELLVSRGVSTRFPDYRGLIDRDAECFFGVRLHDSAGEPLGVLAIADAKPLADEATARTVMRIFAARAGAELERMRATASLARSEARFRDLTELSSDWYWEQDEDFRFVDMTDSPTGTSPLRAPRYVGMTRWEAHGRQLSAEHWAAHRRQLEAREEFRDLEYQRPSRDGRMRWVSISGRPFYDEQGRFRGYRGIGRDITARKRAESVLRASEARFSTAFHSSPLAILISREVDGRILDANEAMCKLSGYGRSELIGQGTADLGLWAEPARRAELIALLGKGEPVRSFEWRLRTRTGEARDVQNWVDRIELGGEPCLLGLLLDVTERRRSEQALRDSEAQLRLIADNVPAMIAYIDSELRYRYANRSFAEFYLGGAPPEPGTLLGGKLGAAALAQARPALERALAGETVHYESERRGLDGTARHVDVAFLPHRAESGEVRGVYLFILDLTQRVRAEQALRERAVLESANEELNAFAYTVAHDLRAPLRAIAGFAGMLRESDGARLSGEGSHLLARVDSSARRLHDLIESLLKYARSAQSELRRAPLDLHGIAREVIEELLPLYPSARFSVGRLPPASGDATLVREVFANLIGNALKFSAGRAQPEIEIGALASARGEALYVRDNGAGFDPRYAGRLFGVFQRLHSEAEFSGSGVGLAFARRVIARHGGEIWAESAPGEGATFYFTLPGAT